MSKFNITETNKTTNLAGGFAFKMSPQMELVHAVATTFLKDKFYEGGEARMERIRTLVQLNKPEFVAKLAVIARKEFHLRSVTTLLLGELAKTHKGDSLVRNAIVAATERVDDLTELLAYLGKPIPKQVKRGIRTSLLKFNRYQLAKYRAEGKGMSLVDLFNLVHPNPKHATAEQSKAWDDLINGKLVSEDTWETTISNTKDKKSSWENLVLTNKIGYMALLRNLNNLISEGVSRDTINHAASRLADADEVKKSKQLPFRFFTAYHNIGAERVLADAITKAADLSLSNVPKLDGKTLVAVDASGSMGGDPIQKAAMFGAALFRANDADLILYDTNVREVVSSGLTPVIDLATRIVDAPMGGGTETSLVFHYAANKHYDRVIIISDNESWAESWGGHGVQSAYEDYKRASGADPYVYAVDIEGYGTTDVNGGKVFHLTGWSDRLLDFIGKVEQGDTLVKYIENYEGVSV